MVAADLLEDTSCSMSEPVKHSPVVSVPHAGGEPDSEPGSETMVVRSCSCASLACPRCGPWRGRVLADRIWDRFKKLGREKAMFLTFSFDPKLWGHLSQFEWYREVMRRSLVRQAMRELGRLLGWSSVAGTYIRKMEFGGRNGRLHFHVLFDYGNPLPKPVFKAFLAWCLKNFGRLGVEPCCDVRRSSEGIILYTSKGIVPYTGKGVGKLPQEFLECKRRIRWFQSSNGYFEPVESREPQRMSEGRRASRSLDVILEACGESTVILADTVADDGERCRAFKGTVAVKLETLVELIMEDAGGERYGWSACVQLNGKEARWVEIRISRRGLTILLRDAVEASGGETPGPRSGQAASPRLLPYKSEGGLADWLHPLACEEGAFA